MGQKMIRVVMLGPARNVHGGISATVNNYYQAGLAEKVALTYIATMVDGNKCRKLLQAVGAYLKFLTYLPRMDILHANMASDSSYYRKMLFIRTAAMVRKKIIIYSRGGNFEQFYYKESSPGAQKRIRATLNMAERFIVLSPEWKVFFEPLVEAEKITVMGNGVIVPTKKKESHAGQGLLLLGRLCREKGVGELLCVMPRLLAEFPNVHLYLAGVWEDDGLREKAARMPECVTYLGWIDKDVQMEYMEKCSVFVLPTYFEGQPNVLLEAMAFGMATLSTAVGGIPQLITDGLNGKLVAPRDAEALYLALLELLSSEDKRQSYGAAARRHMESRPGLAELVEKLCEIYESLYENKNMSLRA